jgi:hypothetical protein
VKKSPSRTLPVDGLPPVDTKDPGAVWRFVDACFLRMYPRRRTQRLRRVFRFVADLFSGRHPGYSANDLEYHDFEHTLQATVCLVSLLEGRRLSGVQPAVDARRCELALAAVLLHDSGFIKLRDDRRGTGAKYTFCHVLRSGALAASHLPDLGFDHDEIETVVHAINCTGPSAEVPRIPFREPADRILGCAVTTADFLAQMAAPDYPDELPLLFAEFRECDEFTRVEPSRRKFRSVAQLQRDTPAFWNRIVRRKLESDFLAVYRFLARPSPGGRNPYIAAVERNIAEISRRTAAGA